MIKKMKKWSIGLSACIALLCFAGTASAHVTVNPGVSAPGAWETYTMKVPVEKNIPTTKVTMKVPEGVEFVSYQPIPGWKVTLDKDKSGKAKTITWSATDKGILPGEFQQFQFIAKNPEKETNAAWNAFQYYKDGSIVEWTGDEGSESPHSITKITSAAASSDEHAGHDTKQHDLTKEKEDKTSNENDSSQTVMMTLSIIALILSVIAVVMAVIKRK